MTREPTNFECAAIIISGVVVVVLLFVVLPIESVNWYTACRQRSVYNRLHHTSFTCADFFWAGDQLNTGTQTINLGQGQ